MDHPVEAPHADILLDTRAGEHDVVAGVGVVVGVALAAVEHIVAEDRALEEDVTVVAGDVVETTAALHPVVAGTAEQRVDAVATVDEIVAGAAQDLLAVGAADNEVMAVAGEDQVEAVAAMDHVVAGAGLDDVVAADVGDDVVAVTALDDVVAVATLQTVVAAVAPQGVVADAADQGVVAFGATQHHMGFTVVAQITFATFHHGRQRLHDGIAPDRVGADLQRLVQLEDMVYRGEQIPRQVRGARLTKVGIGHHQRGEGVGLQRPQQVEPLGTRQVVEAVAVLQFFHLYFKDEVEGRAEHAAERHLALGQAADPEVHQVQAGLPVGPGAAAVEEVGAIARAAATAHHQQGGGGALGLGGIGREDTLVLAVGGDEVDDRCRVLDVQREIDPADIGLEVAVAGGGEELLARTVERRHAGVAAAGDIDRRQIQGQPHQVVAQGAGDELVDLVTGLPGHAADDRAGHDIGIGAAELDRIEEGLDQADVAGLHVEAQPIHRFVEHGVAEAVHHVGELGDDGCIDLNIRLHHEDIGERLDLAHELLEHQVLVLHLVDEARGLKQALAIPDQPVGTLRHLVDLHQQPLVDKGQIAAGEDGLLVGLHQAIVLGVEHMVHRGQADVLVAATVAGDVVGVEQFVVVLLVASGHGIDRYGIAHVAVAIGHQLPADNHRHRVVGDIVEEGMTGAYGPLGADGTVRIALHLHWRIAGHDQHGETVLATDELTVLVGGQQRHVGHIGIGEVDAEHLARLRLDIGPGGQAAVGPVEQMPGGHRLAVDHHVLAQENLVRGVRGVGLVLVDEGGGLVDMLAHVVGRAEDAIRPRLVGGAGENHEVAVRALNIQRVIRLQRDIHGAAAALVDQIQAMVEELAEQAHPGVERRAQAFVRRHVGHLHAAVVHDDAHIVQQRIQRRRGGGDRSVVGRGLGQNGLVRSSVAGQLRGRCLCLLVGSLRGSRRLGGHRGLGIGISLGLGGGDRRTEEGRLGGAFVWRVNGRNIGLQGQALHRHRAGDHGQGSAVDLGVLAGQRLCGRGRGAGGLSRSRGRSQRSGAGLHLSAVASSRAFGRFQCVVRLHYQLCIAEDVAGAGVLQRGHHRRRVVQALVDDQVADHPRLRIHHIAAGLFIAGLGARTGEAGGRAVAVDAVFRVAELRLQQARHGLVGRAVVLLARHQVVVGAVDRAQTIG